MVLNYCSDVTVNNCETARNGWYGILVSESSNVAISGNLVEANDAEGIMIQYLFNGSENVSLTGNLIHYNQGFGITSFAGKNIKSSKNTFAGNGTDLKSNEKISSEKFINMQ
jgi:parallel beta-helix repeat protein